MISSSPSSRSRWKVAPVLIGILAAIILVFGLYFVILGSELAWLGGSWYYVLCGILLTASGILMLRQQAMGGWLYLLAWFLTIPWTIYEVGFDFWGWLPRLLGPTLIAIAVAFSLLALSRIQKEARHA
ncbi:MULTISPECIES: glycerol dehydrogenase [unclassified Saccharibacter]|uniref:glycerol dehydrogenase n=1 Tax=unclassified Saccharibacter TaxID=2648722 RepID=UPI001322A556|nr:glycerol dehydrogenase [Saccharibacter sp. EH70]MXV35346.1 glycerol dehydrogenase [Saccharibacter sp. EH611]MXV57806.1 glycerol dehydrogenase [Saccharibacter sp. EH70]MXV65280.1 glycerol dehydrogenase [Saccharibacter sp. EH60]